MVPRFPCSAPSSVKTRPRCCDRDVNRPAADGSGSVAARDRALVLLAEQRDHVVDVRVVLDPPRAGTAAVGEDRVVDDAAGREQLVEDVLGEAEVRGVIAVQVADLPAPDAKRPLAPPAEAGLDAGP